MEHFSFPLIVDQLFRWGSTWGGSICQLLLGPGTNTLHT